MDVFEQNSTDSENGESDDELQEAFTAGLIKPGLNKIDIRKQFVNDVKGLRIKIKEISLNLPWIEILNCVSKQAPLAPELAAQMLEQEQKRENQLKNNKKLPQFSPNEDPVLNDFKREMMFHRQAQSAVLEVIPKLKDLGVLTKRPDDYFAEMAKTDDHMHKIRERLMQKQAQQQQSERVKQLRIQRKEGKAIHAQAKLERLKEKKSMMEQVKKIRKGLSNDMSFLNSKQKNQNSKNISKKAIDKKNMKEKKFGFGGKKKGMKRNTKDSAANIDEYKTKRINQSMGNKRSTNKRLGKNRRIRNKAKGNK